MQGHKVSCGLALMVFAVQVWACGMPKQMAPDAYVMVKYPDAYAERILLQGLAGLAAQAVNEGMADELVCLDLAENRYPEWKERTVRRLHIEKRGDFNVWELLHRYADRDWVKGYVLYTSTEVDGAQNASVNVATSMSGILQAVPVDEAIEEQVEKRGLKMLFDARDMSAEECFAKYKNEFSRNFLCLVNPQKEFVRDVAIAHKGFVAFGNSDFTWSVVEWLNPLAPILGWNEGDEKAHTIPVSQYAHYNTASDWAKNLTFLMAGAEDARLGRAHLSNPDAIAWQDERPCVAFVMSDGDNTGWLMGNFWSEDYFDSAENGTFPMGWSACTHTLSGLAPAVQQHLVETQHENGSLIEFSGGYFYPDCFGEKYSSAEREELLRKHARTVGAVMDKSNVRLLCLIAQQSDSPSAQQAYEIFAEEIPGLLGILVMDYAPYHRMKGEVYWVRDHEGRELPVMTARYAMWAGMKRPLAGGPSEIASAIHQDADGNGPSFAWVAVHAWSKHADPDSGKNRKGLDAVAHCIEQLDDNKIHLVSPEEMLWRLRYKRNPDETKALMIQFQGQ